MLVHENRICFGTWNIGTLTGKSMAVVDTMTRRRINFMCIGMSMGIHGYR